MTATFQQFCITAHLNISEQANRYPLTALAQAYLQDWFEGHQIDGGVAFETELRQLNLDGSLASLTLLDGFLDSIRPELPNDSSLLDRNASQRNLLNFIGFYTGMVYAYQANRPAYWLTYAQLIAHFPNLWQVIPDTFDYSMVISRQDLLADTRPFFAVDFNQTTFFPLVVIWERLYCKRQPTAQPPANELKHPHGNVPSFGYIAPSLAESVRQLLSNHSASWSQPSDFARVDTAQDPISPQFDLPFDGGNNRVTQDIFGHARLTHWINNPFIQLPTVSYGSDYLYQPFVHPFIKPAETHTQLPPDSALLEMPVTQGIEPEVRQSDTGILENSPVIETLAKTLAETSPSRNPSMPLVSEAITPSKPNPLAKPAAKSTVKAQKQALHHAMLTRQKTQRQKKVAEALANPTIHPRLLNQSHSMVREDSDEDKLSPITDSFSSLEADLANISLANADPTLEQGYQATRKVLLSYRAINRHNQPNAPFVFPESEQRIVEQAIHQLTQQAEQQHTGAMLMLAMAYFRGEPALGVPQDTAKAIEWIQQAAKLQDSRAEKLLSKLYFSGELVDMGVPQDLVIAQEWLESAASHGHPDAIILQQQMAISQALKSTQREDSLYLQRLILGIVALVIFLIVVILTIKI